MYQLEDLRGKANNTHENVVETITETKSGYPGESLSSIEIATAIYFTQMDITPDNMASMSRDRFILSKGHTSLLLHFVLAEKELIEEEGLLAFRKINPRLQGHPSMHKPPGVGISAGSLGQGISCTIGMTLANKCDKEDHRIHTISGDGERQGRQVWEAAMAISRYRLGNLLAFVDHSGLQIDGNVADVMNPTSIDERFEAFGWNAIVLENGNGPESVTTACGGAETVKGKPTVVAACVVKGRGISSVENRAGRHETTPNAEQCAEMIAELEGGRK